MGCLGPHRECHTEAWEWVTSVTKEPFGRLETFFISTVKFYQVSFITAPNLA